MPIEVGNILEGTVTGITKFGAFVALPEGKTGMVHISEIAPTFVKEIKDYLQEKQTVKVKVLNIDQNGRISLSIKQADSAYGAEQQKASLGGRRSGGGQWQHKGGERSLSFEDMISKYKQDSDEKMSDLKRSFESKRGSFSKRGSYKY